MHCLGGRKGKERKGRKSALHSPLRGTNGFFPPVGGYSACGWKRERDERGCRARGGETLGGLCGAPMRSEGGFGGCLTTSLAAAATAIAAATAAGIDFDKFGLPACLLSLLDCSAPSFSTCPPTAAATGNGESHGGSGLIRSHTHA